MNSGTVLIVTLLGEKFSINIVRLYESPTDIFLGILKENLNALPTVNPL